MKKILISLALVAIASTCWAGQTVTRIYDGKGHLVGTVRESNINYQTYNSEGKYLGRVVKNRDGSRTAWSRDGDFVGKSTCVGDSCRTEDKGEDD